MQLHFVASSCPAGFGFFLSLGELSWSVSFGDVASSPLGQQLAD